MKFLATSNEIRNFPDTQKLYDYLKQITHDREGYGYYKYPVAGGDEIEIPDIVLIDKEYGVCAIDVYSYPLDFIPFFDEMEWKLEDKVYDSPFIKLEDYEVSMESKYKRYRILRRKVSINTIIVLPLIEKEMFIKKFPDINIDNVIFKDYLDKKYDDFWLEKSNFSINEADLFIAVSQGAGPLNNYKGNYSGGKVNKIGEAIKLIDVKINSLDSEQHAAAIQIPDGPQRIRGMAGTGKTIILTMKAAFLHARHPDKKILYTFHTQSLYNQVRKLITRFYREDKKTDPNWDNLLVMHSWGGASKEGVYYRTCLRNSIRPLPFSRSHANPLDYVCSEVLKHDLTEEFDFVLVDEAQDLPPSFFQLLYHTTKNPKRIIFAYDELQSLDSEEFLDVDELFGYENGKPRVDFSAGSYGNDIEMDYVLKKSYRNPLEVLMLAHGIGLGIYNPTGIMQVIEEKKIWSSIGYEVIEGNCQSNDEMVIQRPMENSVSAIREFYDGKFKPVEYKKFNSRDEEIKGIASRIINDVNEENVLPHDIVVITLDNSNIKNNFAHLQNILFNTRNSEYNSGY
ncbi:MAG: DEAD/DEAH box helicase [Halanaerobiales bacterium]|nr:DEAD/DEAH box helicase [Halanaerobiales bacterium]